MSVILTLNAGSSSVKFAVFQAEEEIFGGQVERLGPDAVLHMDGSDEKFLGMTDHARAVSEILEAIEEANPALVIDGVGHRIAHGGVDFEGPAVLTSKVIEKLELLTPFAPLHQPHNLSCVTKAQTAFPDALHVGSFDTAFHRSHPWVNDTFALPRRFYAEGVRRFGFHGLSYDYITSVLKAEHAELYAGNVVIAHLGNGASLCAVKGGRSIASTMGFSALDGLPMGTRSGQLDPGVLLYLMSQKGMSASEIEWLLYRESGLLGLSGLTHDMRTLQASDLPEAKQAIDYFCFRIRREIGAMVASLGGLDALIFCGGIGENSERIRQEVIAPLGIFGLGTKVPVKVIRTNEELVMARATQNFLRA